MTEQQRFNRCADGRACVEVTSRLHAADLAKRTGYPEHADRLRTTAATFAEAHHYGTPRRGADQ